MAELKITETVLRDGNQSLAATRIPIDEIVPVLDEMNKVGYASIECWGGATFDACLRYLNEDPWERLRLYRRRLPNTKLQMLMRGQCILGYKHYPDEVVHRFVKAACDNGIDIIRIFDALNDIENIRVAVHATRNYGKEASGAMCFTKSPYHHLDDYIDLAKKMIQIGVNSLCIKDMSGILSPKETYELIARLKDTFDVPVILHSHCTSGLAYLSYYEAIRAGVDVLDTCISAFSGGTSQPSTELLVQVAKEQGREVLLDEIALDRVNLHFRGVRERMEKDGRINYKSLIPNPRIIKSQIPGGMYSNLLSQLKAHGIEEKLQKVIEEVPNVRRDMGYPPLVTPISQMIGVQSVINIAWNKRYHCVISEVKDYVLGKYGSPPGDISSDLLGHVEEEEDLEENPDKHDLTSAMAQTIAIQKDSEEDQLTQLLFPELGRAYLKKDKGPREDLPWTDTIRVIPSPDDITDINMESGSTRREDKMLRSSLPGSVVKMCVKKDEKVAVGQVLLIVETMKMENKVISEVEGTISNVFVSQGSSILKGDPLLKLAVN